MGHRMRKTAAAEPPGHRVGSAARSVRFGAHGTQLRDLALAKIGRFIHNCSEHR